MLSPAIIAEARDLGHLELVAMLESAYYQIADIEEIYGSDAVVQCELLDYLSVMEAELMRRIEVHRRRPETPEIWSQCYQAWRELADEVNARADIVAIFQNAGYVLAYAGRNSERASEEWAGRCPFCGGKDRFRVWTSGRFGGGGYWCRQCDKSGDAVAAYRQMTGASFTETVRELATRLGLSIDRVDSPSRAKQPKKKKTRRERQSLEIGVA
jgi:hypothetical protein